MGKINISLAALMGEYSQIVVNEAFSIEAMAKSANAKLANPENPMKVDLITDKIITNSKLLPVTDPIAFSSGMPTEGGLFSEKIFGQTLEDKRRQYAYIDLNAQFFHPYVYEVLKFMMPKKFDKCASGKGSWYIDNDGALTEITDTNDPNYDTSNSGISWLIRNYHKLKFTKTNSMTRTDRINFLSALTDEDLFITKWTVIPIIYRDVDMRKGTHVLPELNDHYNSIIRYANSIKDSSFDFFDNEVKYNLQKELIAIRQYGQSLLEKKTGFFHRFILGKSVDRGSRDVISVQTFNGSKRPEDCAVDIEHTGLPLAKCLILGYNFIMRYCLKFFEDNFRGVKEYPVYDLVNGEYKIVGSINIKNPLEKYDSKYLEKKINRFKNSHGTRFELVTIEAENGVEIPIHISGQFTPLTPTQYKNSTTIINRPMTWTDLFYIAAMDTLSDKYVYITRYPITSYASIFMTLCRPLSTIDTMPAIVNGVEYRWYPVIDLKTSTSKISNLFIDTTTMSDLYLDALGGDYDGDQVSERVCFTLEANAEAVKLSKSPTNFITPDGKLLRVLGKEAYLTFYNITRPDPPGGILSNDLKKELLALDAKKISINDISKLFGITSTVVTDEKGNKKFVKTEPKFNLRSKLVLDANEYINKEQIVTTVGIFLFNKLMVESYISSIVPNGYYNEVCNKKVFGKLCDIVASAVMQKNIDIEKQLIPWLNAYEFWGLGLVAIFAPSFSMELITPNKEIQALKEKLLAEAPDKSLATLSKIEATLVAKADELTKGTPGKWLFDSGARGSFSNDFKNMAISIGVVENPVTGEYDFMQSNYINGISKEDIPAAANSIVNAEYPKAIKTAKGGYMTKQLFASNQNIQVDKAGSDCGTTRGLTVVLTKENVDQYYEQYLIDGKDLVLITEDLPSKYFNKKVIIRSPMYCTSDKICNKCAGERFYKLGVSNAGLFSSSIAGQLQNLSLKLRHDLSVKVNQVDIDTLLR